MASKYGKYFLATEADDLGLDLPPVETVDNEGQPPADASADAGEPTLPRNMRVIEIKPRRLNRFKLPDPDEDDLLDTPVDGSGLDLPPVDGDEPVDPEVPDFNNLPPEEGLALPGEDLSGADTGLDLPPVDGTEPVDNTGADAGLNLPPVDGTAPTEPTPAPAPEPAPVAPSAEAPTPAPTPQEPVPGEAPTAPTEPVPPAPAPDANAGLNLPPVDDGNSVSTTDGAPPPPAPDAAPMDPNAAPVIDDQNPDFDADAPMDDVPPEGAGQPSSNGPGLEYDSTRKYVLFKNYLSLSNAIDNYISKLEVNMGNDEKETVLLKSATDQLREINELCYDYITMKFEISSYIQALFFFQNLVVMVQKVFELLSKTKKKLKSATNAKKH